MTTDAYLHARSLDGCRSALNQRWLMRHMCGLRRPCPQGTRTTSIISNIQPQSIGNFRFSMTRQQDGQLRNGSATWLIERSPHRVGPSSRDIFISCVWVAVSPKGLQRLRAATIFSRRLDSASCCGVFPSRSCTFLSAPARSREKHTWCRRQGGQGRGGRDGAVGEKEPGLACWSSERFSGHSLSAAAF